MAGPVNGAKANNGSLGVIVPTLVQTASDLYKFWSSMTCVYDPNWVQDYNKITVPISLFQVTSMHEISKTNVSTKRVILYEPQSQNTAAEMAKLVRPSVLRSIVDNVYREPRAYNLEIVLPFLLTGRLFSDYVKLVDSTIGLFTAQLGGDSSEVVNNINSMLSGVSDVALQAYNVVKAASQLPSMDDVSYINKNSLDAMNDRSHFLCMKMWTGYDYKFVMITSMDISKKPTEDDIFRGTMQVQEMPVMCVNRPTDGKAVSVSGNPVVAIISGVETALSDILVTTTGVKTASE